MKASIRQLPPLARALTIRQPWAWAVVAGHKDVENRSWSTPFRGTIAIHAGYAEDLEAYADLVAERGRELAIPAYEQMTRGAIVGVVDLVDCVERHTSSWFGGPYGFVLANARMLDRPIECRGQLGLWELSSELADEIRAAIAEG